MKHVCLNQIAGVLPHYSSGGDETIIITKSGDTYTVPGSMRCFLNHLAKENGINLDAVKNISRRITHHKLMPPLYLASDVVLFPAKIRRSAVPGDSCNGYINLFSFDCVEADPQQPDQSIIMLDNGQTITSLWTAATVKEHIFAAENVLNGYLDRISGCSEPVLLAILPEYHAMFTQLMADFIRLIALLLRKK